MLNGVVSSKTYCDLNISSSHGLEEIKVIFRIKIQWHVELSLFLQFKNGIPNKKLEFLKDVQVSLFFACVFGCVFSYQIASIPMLWNHDN